MSAPTSRGDQGPVPDPPESPRTDTQLPTTQHDWTTRWNGSGAAIIISGGTLSVSTEDLDTMATTLSTAADSLDDAVTQANNVLAEVRTRPGPVVDPASADKAIFYRVPSTSQIVLSLDGPDLPTYPGVELEPLPPASPAMDFEMKRTAAIGALTSLTTGPGSLSDASDTLRALSADLTACADLYEQAENRAAPAGTSPVGAVDAAAFDNAMLALLGPALVALGQEATDPQSLVEAATLLLAAQGDRLEIYQGVQVLLGDPGTAQWVKEDFARLVLMSWWLTEARTGRESATIQGYLDAVATRLDPWISQGLPDTAQVGTQVVPVEDLTAMQRACLYLAQSSQSSGARLFGTPTGVSVRPVGGREAVVRPPSRDPYGLASPVPAGSAGSGAPAQAPRSISETIRHCHEVQGIAGRERSAGNEVGSISIQRTQHDDGRVSWVVYVPGTTDWTAGSREPQDLLTNLEGVAGTPTVMESAVVTAMRQAGIAPGEEVAMYGHSQGGITVTNLASDPAIQERYHVTSILTAGAPTAGAQLPESVQALHLENTGDAVPGLDGAATPTGPNRQVALIDTHDMDIAAYPHGSLVYADAAEGLEEHYPEIAPWSQAFTSASGAGEEGATTTEYVFLINRDFTAPNPRPAPGSAPAPSLSEPVARPQSRPADPG